ncbi:MAG: trypsin-like peptidase domain-containing protein [Oscillospiraceae bacterium]|nr:trypsin-like peptidase domain-containing protein [Oscillospiraceae bacterium]
MSEYERENIDSGPEGTPVQTAPPAQDPSPDRDPGQLDYSQESEAARPALEFVEPVYTPKTEPKAAQSAPLPVFETPPPEHGAGSRSRGRYHGGFVRNMGGGSFAPPYIGGSQGQPQNPYQYGNSHSWKPLEGQPGYGYQWNFAEYDKSPPQKGRKKRNRGVVVFVMAVLCLISVGMLGIAGYNVIWAVTGSEPAADNVSQQPWVPSAPSGEGGFTIPIEGRPPTDDYTPSVGELMTIPQVARVVRPSVVGIVNYQASHLLIPTTGGSGIIISEDGYIVTNAHVVEGSDSLRVVFDDNTEAEAFLVGYDNRTDLAVIRVNQTGLTAAVFGDSNQLEVGETVVAIGNPGGLELAGSVTRGVVSAVNRVITTPFNSTTFIQTDAAINPGNSGGPLCNEFGQVIGINTAKIVEIGYEGIGFAIPISDAIPVIEDLISNGRVTGRPLLGITGMIVTETDARERGWPPGVQIDSISSTELISRGVIRGDIITYIDGERILNLNDIAAVLAARQVGDIVNIVLHRPALVGEGTTFEIDVPLIEA